MNAQKPMKTNSSLQIIGASLLALTVLWLAGCASVGYNKGDATARALENAATQAQDESRTLELTMTSLNDLVNKPAADLKPQFEKFSKALDQLAAAEKRTDAASISVSEKGAVYFQAWDQELAGMSYEPIRNQGRTRKAEVTKTFDDVTHRYHEAQASLPPLLDYLRDIRKSLRSELTPGGLASVKNLVANAQDKADNSQKALAKVAADLTTLSKSMSSSVAPPAAVAGTNQPPASASKEAGSTKK